MGVVTVFSIDGCPHCIKMKEALTKRDIPYVEINLGTHPEKRTGMLALSDDFRVPQVFFNSEYIGGAGNSMYMLNKLDEKTDNGAKQYFDKEVLPKPGPTDPRLLPSSEPPDYTWKVEPPRGDYELVTLPIDDGDQRLSVLEVTSRLANSLQNDSGKRGLVSRNVMLTVLQTEFGSINTDDEEWEKFMEVLESYNIIHTVTSICSKSRLRLQPYMTPRILNSYRIWPKGDDVVNLDPLAHIKRLTKLFNEMTTRATTDGEADLQVVREDGDYNNFCEASCRLQVINMADMDPETRTAFVLNVYNLMIRFAQVQLGVATTHYKLYYYFTEIKIDIGGHLFSFHDLESGILRGNKPPPYSLIKPFGKKDARLGLALEEPDQRIHFALNCGASSCPPVKEFTKEGLDEELKVAAISFCRDDENVLILPKRGETKGGVAALSKILLWYRGDFATSKAQLPRSIMRFLTEQKKKTLVRIIGVDWVASREGANGGQSSSNLDYKYPLRVIWYKYDWTVHGIKNAMTYKKWPFS